MPPETDDAITPVEPRMLQRPDSDDVTNSVCKELTGNRSLYSVVRVRAVICTVSILFYIAAVPSNVMVSQYLIDRLSLEQNFNGSNRNGTQCYNNLNDSAAAQADQIQAEVSNMMMIYIYCTSVPGFLSGLLIGAYADYIGRRFTLLTPLLGMSIKYTMVAVIIRFNLSYWMFYLAFTLEGLTGSGFVVILAMFTITADSNTGKLDRVLWINIVTALGNIMAAASSVVSGVMIRELGYFPTSAFLMSIVIVSFLIPLALLPETKPHQTVRVLNLGKNVKRVFGFFIFDGTIRMKLTFLITLLMFFFAVITELGVGAIDTLYQLREPFCWSSDLIGYYSALRIGGASFAAMFVLAALQRCMRAEFIGLVAAISQTMSFCLEAFVKTDWQFFLVPVVKIPGLLIIPVIRGILSLLAGPDKQGALFTSACMFELACYMASGTVFNKLYAETVSTFPGAVYLCMAAFGGLTCALIVLYLRVHRDSGKFEYEQVINEDETEPQVNAVSS